MGKYSDREKNKFNNYDYYIFVNWYKDEYGSYPYNNPINGWCCGGEFYLYSDKDRTKLIVCGSELDGTKFEIVDENIRNDFIDYLHNNCIPKIENKEDIIDEIMYKISNKFTIENMLTELLNVVKLGNEYKTLEKKLDKINNDYRDLGIRFNIATELIKKNELLDEFNNECDQYYK